MKTNKKEMTAGQKLQALEAAVTTLDQALYNMSKQVAALREAMSLINDKLTSVVEGLSTGAQINDAVLDQLNQARKLNELKGKIQKLVDDGIAKKSDTSTENSVLVFREMNNDGTVANQRIQAAVVSLDKTVQEKLVGKIVGDKIVLQDDAASYLEIEEIYEIVKATEEQPQEEAQA